MYSDEHRDGNDPYYEEQENEAAGAGIEQTSLSPDDDDYDNYDDEYASEADSQEDGNYYGDERSSGESSGQQ